MCFFVFLCRPHPFTPLYPLFSFPLRLFCIMVAPFSSSLSLSLPPSLSFSPSYFLFNSCSYFAFCPFLYTSSVEFDSPDIPLPLSHSFLYAAFSPPPRNSMCSSSTCSALGRCQTSVNGFQLCLPLAVQLLSFRLVSASMAAATHSKP